MNFEQREKRWGELMKQAQAGDQGCYRELLDELRESFAAYLARRPMRGIDSEDIIQSALLAVHNARHTYLPSKPFAPWAYTILRYKLADALRSSYRNQGRFTSLDETHLNSGEEPASDLRIDAAAAFEELSDRQQELFLLVREEGLSFSEVAERLSSTENALRVMMHRTMKQLKRRLGSGS